MTSLSFDSSNALPGFRPEAAPDASRLPSFRMDEGGATTPVREATTVAAVPLVIGGGLGLKWLAAAVAGGAGIGWNSLSPQDQQKLQDAIGRKLSDWVQNGRIGLGKITQMLGELAAGGLANAGSILSRGLGSGLVDELKQLSRSVLQIATGSPPSPATVANVVNSLKVTNECRPMDPDDLGGQCGRCTSEAYQELRNLRRHPDPEIASIARNIEQLPVRNGAHFVLKLVTSAGDYILDCTFGQFPGARQANGGQNVFFGTASRYFELLKKVGHHTPF